MLFLAPSTFPGHNITAVALRIILYHRLISFNPIIISDSKRTMGLLHGDGQIETSQYEPLRLMCQRAGLCMKSEREPSIRRGIGDLQGRRKVRLCWCSSRSPSSTKKRVGWSDLKGKGREQERSIRWQSWNARRGWWWWRLRLKNAFWWVGWGGRTENKRI